LATWTAPQYHPANNVVGRWPNNASFVVVAPKWIITTRHQGYSPASALVINGITYNCIQNTLWTGGPTGNADIRLIRLKNLDGSDPNLAHAEPYDANDEKNQNIRIGGYGKYRGATLYLSSKDYGYLWAGTSNDTLRWGENIIDGNLPLQHVSSFYSDTIYADFDENGTTYEAAQADWDSGGGWFINQNGTWKLAALSAYVTRLDEIWYNDPNTRWIVDPDYIFGIRISSYATWIDGIITADCNSPVVGDFNNDCKVDFLDFADFANEWLSSDCTITNNYCYGADFAATRNGSVDFSDLLIFAQNWLVNKSLSLPQ
jgi:hypothetical protein